MLQLKCTQCGTQIQPGGRFCPKCGCVVSPEQRSQVTDVTQSAADRRPVQAAPPVQNEGANKKKEAVASVILSIFVSLLLILLGVAASAVFIVRQGLTQSAIESAVSKVEFAELKTGALSGSGNKKETLPELIYDSLSPQIQADMADRDATIATIEDIVEEDYVRDFVAEKVNDYVTDILTDSGDGEITADEVVSFLKDNKKDLESLFNNDYHFTDADFDEVEEYLTQNKILDDYRFSKIRRTNRSTFDMIQRFSSYVVLAILLGLCVLFAVCLFFINRKSGKAMIFIGISFVVIGILDCAFGIGINQFAKVLNDLVELGKGFYTTLLAPVKRTSFIVGGSVIAIGALVAILPQIFSKNKVVHK